VDALFALFDGVHAHCVAMQSPGARGPYDAVEKALRLRLFLCVAGDTWAKRPTLAAKAAKRVFAFARAEEDLEDDAAKKSAAASASGSVADSAAPRDRTGPDRPPGFFLARTQSAPSRSGSYTSVTSKAAASSPVRHGPAGSAPPEKDPAAARRPAPSRSVFRRAAPSFAHSMVDVSSWRAVARELDKVRPGRMAAVAGRLCAEIERLERAARSINETSETPSPSSPPSRSPSGSRDAFAIAPGTRPSRVDVDVAAAGFGAPGFEPPGAPYPNARVAACEATLVAETLGNVGAAAMNVARSARAASRAAAAVADARAFLGASASAAESAWERFDPPSTPAARVEANERRARGERPEGSGSATLNPFAGRGADARPRAAENLTRAEFEDMLRRLDEA
jgi:hypothetical protein